MTQKLTTPELLKKHHFWIVLGVGAVVLPLGLWFYGIGNVKAMTDSERSAREQMHTRVDSVRPTNHPNEKFKVIVDNTQATNSQHVYDGWLLRYNAQKDLIEKWPSWLPSDYLEQIQASIAQGKEIPSQIRQAYLNRIKEEFPALYEKIAGGLRLPTSARVDDALGAPGGEGRLVGGRPARPGGGGAPGGAYSGLLAWEPNERSMLELKLGGSWTTPPSHNQMIYTQETLNVYEALIVHIINALNQGASEHHQASIKKIQSLLIGRDAEPLPVTSAPEDVPAEQNPDEEQQYDPTRAQGRVARGSLNTGQDAPDGSYRFVDAQGKPVADQKLAPPFAEFRMLPVSMQLVMDHSKIPELLALCANSPLPLEVRQVNVSALGGARVQATTAINEEETSSIMGGARRGSQSGGSGGASSSQTQLDAEVEVGPTDMVVEIRGLIYLFNRPDPALIGTGTARTDEPPVTTDPSETPETSEQPGTPPTGETPSPTPSEDTNPA